MKFRLLETVLLEDIEAVKKRYPDIDDETFMKLIAFDPTYVEGRDSVGTYGKWILDRWKKGSISEADFGHLNDVLSRFDKNKTKINKKDINQFKTPEELDNYLNDESNYTLSKRQQKRQNDKAKDEVDVEQDAIHAFNGSSIDVWIPKTYAASCRLGEGTKWCTANTNSDYYYNYYKNKFGGNYYININKRNPEEKWQFHFESNQFMDRHDYRIDLGKFFEIFPESRPFYEKEFNNGDIKATSLKVCVEIFGNETAQKMLDSGKISATLQEYFECLGQDYAMQKILDGTFDISSESLRTIQKVLPKDFFTNPKYFEAAKKYLKHGDHVWEVLNAYEFKHRAIYHYESIPSEEVEKLKETIRKCFSVHELADRGDFLVLSKVYGEKAFDDDYVLSKTPKDIDQALEDFGYDINELLNVKPYKKLFEHNLDECFEKSGGVVQSKFDITDIGTNFGNDSFLIDLLHGEWSDDFWYSYSFDETYQAEKLGERVKSKLKEMGLPEDIFWNMGKYQEQYENDEELGYNGEYDLDDLKDAYARAYSQAQETGTYNEAYKTLNEAVSELPDGISIDWNTTNKQDSSEVYVNIEPSALKDEGFKEDFLNQFGDSYKLSSPEDYEDALYEGLHDWVEENISFEEPPYGFDGFDDDTFQEELCFELGELEDSTK